jgi:hypothetical protein
VILIFYLIGTEEYYSIDAMPYFLNIRDYTKISTTQNTNALFGWRCAQWLWPNYDQVPRWLTDLLALPENELRFEEYSEISPTFSTSK